jgi:hypothetical protein
MTTNVELTGDIFRRLFVLSRHYSHVAVRSSAQNCVIAVKVFGWRERERGVNERLPEAHESALKEHSNKNLRHIIRATVNQL